MKLKIFLSIPTIIFSLALLAAGCSSNGNTLNRPSSDSSSTNSNANSLANTEDNSQSNEQDNGEVAGSQTAQLPTKNIKVNNLELVVELADTDQARAQGLSDREKLEEGKGMLFDFTNSEVKRPGFWMKDMNFSIDIIWISNGKIIAIDPNVPIPSEDEDLAVYHPPSEITHTLEVPAGWSAKNNITVGSSITL